MTRPTRPRPSPGPKRAGISAAAPGHAAVDSEQDTASLSGRHGPTGEQQRVLGPALYSSPSISRETRELLRDRIRIAARIVASGLGLFLIRDLLLTSGAYLPWARLVLILAFAAIGLRLRSRQPLGLVGLRRLEVVMLWALSLWFAADRLFYLHERAVAGDVLEVQFTVDFMVLIYVAFISAYAVFVPNTWDRALTITVPLALLPPLVVGLGLWVHPQDQRILTAGLTTTRVTSLGLMLVLAVAFAAGGARLIYALRQQVWEARELGQYRLTSKIGEGGMGQVWRAEHRLLPRPAAIKLIRPDLLHTSSALHHSDALQRFEREVRATSNLRSPHTVEIYDFGITEDQIFYYVMELLDGLDLKSLVQQHGPLPDGRVAFLLAQAAQSLAEAHEQGLVHRDVKPANIYACRLGNRFDFVKVLDFGLVAATDPGLMETAHSNRAVGTPAFMAPESARGDAFVDARADLYALGCVGYWLLTGSLVFAASGAAEMVREHQHTLPPAPSVRAGRRVDPTLEEVLMACLHKEPERRPASAAELGVALRNCPAVASWDNEAARLWWHARRP